MTLASERVAMKGFDCWPYLTAPVFQSVDRRSSFPPYRQTVLSVNVYPLQTPVGVGTDSNIEFIANALRAQFERLAECVGAMGFKQYFNREGHPVRTPRSCVAKQFLRPPSQLLHRLPDVGLSQTRHELDCVEKIGLARRVRPHHRR